MSKYPSEIITDSSIDKYIDDGESIDTRNNIMKRIMYTANEIILSKIDKRFSGNKLCYYNLLCYVVIYKVKRFLMV